MKFFFKSFSLRIFSFICAALIWFHVVTEKEYEAEQSLPLILYNRPINILPINNYDKDIRILIKGRGKQLLALKYSKPSLLLDVGKAKLGINQFSLSEKSLKVDGLDGLKLLKVLDLNTLSLTFDPLIRKVLPVKLKTNIQLLDDFILSSKPKIIPDTVLVEGPRLFVATLENVLTAEILLNKINKDTTIVLNLAGLDESKNVKFTPTEVTIEYKVAALVKRNIDNLRVNLLGFPEDKAKLISAKRVSIVIAGAKEVVEKITEDQINIYINYNSFSVEQQIDVVPSVNIIGDVSWSSIKPATISILEKK